MGRRSDAGARLVASIAELVHDRGYAAVGVDEICRRAGVKKGSFYHFFRSKEALMLASLDRRWDDAQHGFLAAAFAKDVAPLRRVERCFEMAATAETAAKRAKGHVLGCPFGNLSAEMSGTAPNIRRRVDGVFERFAGHLERAVREAQAAGHVPKDVDPPAVAQALVAYFEGVMLLARTRNEPRVIKELGRAAVRLAGAPVPARARRARAAENGGKR